MRPGTGARLQVSDSQEVPGGKTSACCSMQIDRQPREGEASCSKLLAGVVSVGGLALSAASV